MRRPFRSSTFKVVPPPIYLYNEHIEHMARWDCQNTGFNRKHRRVAAEKRYKVIRSNIGLSKDGRTFYFGQRQACLSRQRVSFPLNFSIFSLKIIILSFWGPPPIFSFIYFQFWVSVLFSNIICQFLVSHASRNTPLHSPLPPFFSFKHSSLSQS